MYVSLVGVNYSTTPIKFLEKLTIHFSGEGTVPERFGGTFTVPPDQVVTLVDSRCPHGELMQGFVPISRDAFFDTPDAFGELMRVVDAGAEIQMENGCDNHNKKGN